ncbi:MAG: formylglycine-generating enzyme family protein, partial [Cyanobacteria bacterium REEB65]|nr:formylglycine-generating enzyme family protein [Cyanobacteria bacterium REEB65]
YSCVGYRLPTEAEWEYAYRAGTTTAYYDGVNNSVCYAAGDDPTLDTIAYYYQNDNTTTEPVGQKTANSWGLYDMSGNVWQWVWDWYGTYPSGSITNPTGATSGSYRVLRGGSWGYYAGNGRAAYRSDDAPTGRDGYIGCRLVRSAP